MLDLHDQAALASRSGHRFRSWRAVTPHHNALVDAIIGAHLHVIATRRTTTAYDPVDDGKGNQKPIKLGLAPGQREGMEDEFTVVMDLSVDHHIATAAQDRTRRFDGPHFIPTSATGDTLRQWLDSGIDPVAASQARLDALKAQPTAIDHVPHREHGWRARQGEILTLLPVAQERLKAPCAIRKGAILEALKPKPEGQRQAKGHGEDRAALPVASSAEPQQAA